ncbi:hypothetical protein GGS23DRAFT_336038 [Durotheca rogersii]|uniref:uncharacterized protein n=1 Tax=Durotheca rogersii TaxID=419775 RepID=UPI0022202A00|nr:uncharacterized protein GGS23DRAFT_336038 [Durotheca rogersii]KAI5858194.1 hypothetical protein GGS23DRAFT_336038 [Durotheca rogersii]
MASRFRVVSGLFQPVPPRAQFAASSNSNRFSRLSQPFSRTIMAPVSVPPGKHEWLVIIPDKPGTQQKRIEVRQQHFEGLKTFVESGQYKTGGALLNSKPETDDPTKFDWYGSTVVIVAESKEEVQAIISKDIYAATGVWDIEKIWPAKFAFRNP